ncbi:MAG TPA: APC family permease [Symbiobacteriaceae bacterium]|nr:APC family permease [Symbiobacteriaceae bacterium]
MALTLTAYATVVASGFMIGIGGTASEAGPLGTLSYWIIGGLSTFGAAFVFAELGAMFPKSGGIWEHTKQVFGPNSPFAFMVGWMYWFALAFGLNCEIVSAGYYTNWLFPAIPQWVGGLAVVGVLLALNYFGVKASSAVEAIFGAVLIMSFSVFILFGLFKFDPTLYSNFSSNGTVVPFLKTLPYVVIAFCGFEIVTTMAEESVHPERDIPKALIGAATFLTILFGAFSTVAFGLVPWTEWGLYTSTTAPLLSLGAAVLGGFGIIWLSIQSYTGSLSTINGGVIGQVRMLYAMAREGWFPKSFTRVHPKYRVPEVPLWVTGASMVIIAVLPMFSETAWTWAASSASSAMRSFTCWRRRWLSTCGSSGRTWRAPTAASATRSPRCW